MKKVFDKLPPSIFINDLKISKRNSELIGKFLKHQRGYVTEKRLNKYRYSLIRFADLVEKDFDKLTKEEVREAGGIINNGNLSIRTKQDIIKEIKTSFKFLFEDGERMPKIVIGLKPLTTKGRLVLPDEMPTEKIIYKMIKACNNSRDKFWIALQGLDGALRPVEMIRANWGWVKKDKYGHYIVVNTAKKSGDKDTRTIRIIKSEPYFLQWMKDYPQERNDDSPLFINSQNLERIQLSTIHALFRRLKKKLKINGRFYPYLLRHGLITRMSKNPTIPISVLKKFVGHSQRSSTIGEYQHFGDDDLKDMQLQYNGILKNKEEKQDEKKPVKCPKCNKSNEYDAEVCHFCDMAISQNRIVEMDEILEKNNKMMFEQVNKMVGEIMKKNKK